MIKAKVILWDAHAVYGVGVVSQYKWELKSFTAKGILKAMNKAFHIEREYKDEKDMWFSYIVDDVGVMESVEGDVKIVVIRKK